MPIDTQKLLGKTIKPTVVSLLDEERQKFWEQLTPAEQLQAWTLALRESWLLPTEPFLSISHTHLFPLASRFLGEPLNNATYNTAKRAVPGDLSYFYALLKSTTPTAEEQQTYKENYGNNTL